METQLHTDNLGRNILRQELVTYKQVNGRLYKHLTIREFYDDSFVDTSETVVLSVTTFTPEKDKIYET